MRWLGTKFGDGARIENGHEDETNNEARHGAEDDGRNGAVNEAGAETRHGAGYRTGWA